MPVGAEWLSAAIANLPRFRKGRCSKIPTRSSRDSTTGSIGEFTKIG